MSSHHRVKFHSSRRRRSDAFLRSAVAEALERRRLLSTFTVTTLVDSGAGTLRQAIIDADAAGGTDIINFASGLTGTVDLASTLPNLTANITINGFGAGLLTVNGHGHGTVFSVNSGVTAQIQNLAITGGIAASGGGIANHGTLTLANSTISGNSASDAGGGIFNDRNHTLTITNSTVSGNFASYLGGGINNDGLLTITNSTVSANSCPNGGGILNNATVTVNNSTISGNTAEFHGGGIDNGGSTAVGLILPLSVSSPNPSAPQVTRLTTGPSPPAAGMPSSRSTVALGGRH